jgi:hypothetical protein
MEQVKTVVDKPDFEKMAEDWARDNDWPADYTIYEPLKEGYKAGAEKIWNDYLSTPKPEAVVSLQEAKDKIARDNKFVDWQDMQRDLYALDKVHDAIHFMTLASNLHASQFKEEIEELKNANKAIHEFSDKVTEANARLREALETIIRLGPPVLVENVAKSALQPQK